jgi:osmotically-inducible protein OsmY
VDKSSDERIRETTQNALLEDPKVGESVVEVSVINRQVTLRGIVDSPDKKDRAEEIARSIEGVTTVSDEIEVHQHDDEAAVDPTLGPRPPIIPKTNQ